jgi:hypothetical protein
MVEPFALSAYTGYNPSTKLLGDLLNVCANAGSKGIPLSFSTLDFEISNTILSPLNYFIHY